MEIKKITKEIIVEEIQKSLNKLKKINNYQYILYTDESGNEILLYFEELEYFQLKKKIKEFSLRSKALDKNYTNILIKIYHFNIRY